MSKKRPVYVSIPVGHVCLKVGDVLHQQIVIDARDNECTYLRHTLCAAQDENESLKKHLSEAETKIEELEKERAKLDKESLDWYRKYAALRDKYEPKHNAVKPNAETEET